MKTTILTVPDHQVRPTGHLEPWTSRWFAAFELAGYLLLLCLAMVLARRWARRARSADASFDRSAPLTPGERVLHGEVEHAAGEKLAVRVEIDQEGSEQESSGSWSTSWTETNRRVQVRPFTLRHASGKRIRVEPHREVILADAMDGVIRVNLARRVRVAELTPGEAIFAHGLLAEVPDAEGGGYRGGGTALVLRPRKDGRLLLSSEPLGERFRRRCRLHRRFFIATLLLLLAVNLPLLSYYSSLLAGVPGRARVTDLKHLVESDSEGDTHTYRVWLDLLTPVRAKFVDEVDSTLFGRLRVGMEVPARHTVAGSVSTRLGGGASYHVLALLILLLPLMILALVYGVRGPRALSWHEGRALNEGESGRLTDSKPPPPEVEQRASAPGPASKEAE